MGLKLCMPMTICGVFAAPRAGAGLGRRGWHVTGSWSAKAAWSAAGRSKKTPPRGQASKHRISHDSLQTVLSGTSRLGRCGAWPAPGRHHKRR